MGGSLRRKERKKKCEQTSFLDLLSGKVSEILFALGTSEMLAKGLMGGSWGEGSGPCLAPEQIF